MLESEKTYIILMVDDDAEDCQLVREALIEAGRTVDLRFVRDGVEMFEYLRHQGEFEAGYNAPRPDLILLDFKMPRMDGRESIKEIKADRDLRRIPVVALTTSTAEEDIVFAYETGVNSFITKPTTFRKWVEIVELLCKYWFNTVELPPNIKKGSELFIHRR
jgi:CheY-like chemotaxis protein